MKGATAVNEEAKPGGDSGQMGEWGWREEAGLWTFCRVSPARPALGLL